MRPAVHIHSLVGSGVDSGSAGPVSSLHLPGGTTATRWLSRGLSIGRGLGSEVERLLNGDAPTSAHCVLDLRDPSMDLVALTDELDPRWNRGLPRLQATLGELVAQFPALGAKGEYGAVVLDCPGQTDFQRIRKVWSWCRNQGMGLVVRGELPPLSLDGSATVATGEGASGLAWAIRGMLLDPPD